MPHTQVIVGVSPNAVITNASDLYPGSISDKAIVEKSGLLKHFVAEDLILANKGFFIQNIVHPDVSVKINLLKVRSKQRNQLQGVQFKLRGQMQDRNITSRSMVNLALPNLL